MQETEFGPQAFRQALGSFATGVTIITTSSPEGEPVGLTVNSFSSLSLDPPMILWSLAKSARSLPIFRDAGNWTVHILSTEQADLSTRFAKAGEDKFSGLDLEYGIADMPMLKDCSARFQCETAFQYEGGDHVILVGKVLSFTRTEAPPLVFHGGRYAHATERDGRGDPREPHLAGSFNENFLGYLLGRGHFTFYSRVRPLLARENLSDEEFYVLSTLTLKRRMPDPELKAGMAGVLDEQSDKALNALIERGFVTVEEDEKTRIPAYSLSHDGTECALRVIAAGKAVESQVTEGMGYENASVLKSLLKRLLDNLDPDAEALWDGE